MTSTQTYLQLYQAKLGLSPDNILGPKTGHAMMEDLGITDKLLFCLAMGQAQHESGEWVNFRENLNYSEKSLLTGPFRRYYEDKPALAKAHARNPVKIGNYVYANRNGNRGEESGDGYFYRGIFALQLTGANNIKPFLVELGHPEGMDPDKLVDDGRAYFKAIFFWFDKNNADILCKSPTITTVNNVGKKVNRGNTKSTTPLALHNDERVAYTLKLFKVMGVR